jgi:hypothetical protein
MESITCIVLHLRLPISLWVLCPPERLTFCQLLSHRLPRCILAVLVISSSHVDGPSLTKTTTLGKKRLITHQSSLSSPCSYLSGYIPTSCLQSLLPYPIPTRFSFSTRSHARETVSLLNVLRGLMLGYAHRHMYAYECILNERGGWYLHQRCR